MALQTLVIFKHLVLNKLIRNKLQG